MNPESIIRKVIPKLGKKRKPGSPSIHVTIPSALDDVPFQGCNIEFLIERFLEHVVETSHPSKPIKVSVGEKKELADLEQFFCVSPLYWFHLGVDVYARAGLDSGAKRIFESLGGRCPEWVGVEGSESRLGAFYFGTHNTPALILFIQDRGARRKCDLLIPVKELIPSPACAAVGR
jgi:hypothetical protein